MLWNHMSVALRNLRRHKLYAANTVGGLVLGLACCILCLLFVYDELSHDDLLIVADQVSQQGGRDISFAYDTLSVEV